MAKKYPSVLKEFEQLSEQLKADERPGDQIPDVGYEVYKVRLANRSAKRGKSGGFRVVYYVQLADKVVLITVYSKTEQSNITSDAIRQILQEVAPPDDDVDDEE